MTAWIHSPEVRNTLAALYADAKKNDPILRESLKDTHSSNLLEHFQARKNLYMPVNQEFGHLIYALARTSKAKLVVEFGTSFGISTIFLAAAVRDNGGGKVITTEFIEEKALRARKNLAAAGLEDFVEFRVGDARETLQSISLDVDLLFLDGAKNLYFDVLKKVEPRLKYGATIASDNTDHDGLANFLEYIRTPKNGYISSAITTPNRGVNRAHEITVRS